MPVVEISADELLKAVQQLRPDELDGFVDKVLALRAQRIVPRLGELESALLERLQHGFPEDQRKRYDHLRVKRQNEFLTGEEQAELIRFSDALEEWQAQRMQTLVELAQLRQVPLEALMENLGIKPVSNE